MRLPWISQRPSRRSATRRKRSAPLRVRRLERRRVLDAAVTDLIFAPADLDPATAAHDSNEATQITVSANATGSGTLVYDWQLSQGANVVAQGSNSTFQFKPLDNANYSVKLTVTDGDQTVASRTEDVNVHNVRPVLVVALDQEVEEGETLDLSADGGAPPLGLFKEVGLLDTHTATVNWGDGSATEAAAIFAGAGAGAIGGTHAYIEQGEYEVIVSITDDDGGTDTQSFFVLVGNANPTATLGNNGPVNEGASAIVSFTGQFDPNPADAAAGFHYAYDLDNNGTFDVGNGAYAGSGTNDTQMVSAALLAEGPGSRTVRARIIDKDGGFTDYTTTITIDNVAPKLLNLAADDNTINEGQTATIEMTIDDPGAADVFSVEVDWKDGAPADTITGLGLADTSGTIGDTTYQWDAQARQLTVSHLYEDDNPTNTSSDTYAVALVVRDDDLGASNPYQVDVTVANVRSVLVVATDQSLNEGALLDLSGVGAAPPLGLYVDDGKADSHTATVDWGDGSAVEVATVFPGAGAGAIGKTHTYADNGLYTVTVTVTDDDGGFDTQQFMVNVANVRPVLVVAADQAVNEGTLLDLSGIGLAPPLGLFVDPGKVDTHTATVDWGDGTVEAATVFPGAGAGAIGKTHTYLDNGLYTVTVTVTDDDGGFDTQQFMVDVSNVAPSIDTIGISTPINEGQSATLTGTYSDPGTLDTHELDIDWDGDNVFDQTVTVTGGSFSVAHLYPDDNPTGTSSDTFTVHVQLRDDDMDSDTDGVSLTVNNVRPVLVVALDQTVNEGAVLDLSGIGLAPPLGLYVDPGKLDTHTATVDWGDGTVEVATVFPGAGAGAIGKTHTYLDDGLYTVTVTVTDDDGGSDTQQFMVDVSNVAPSIDTIGISTPINEGQSATLTGTYSDPGILDTHELDIDWDGDNIFDQTVTVTGGSFSVAHLYPDDNPTGTSTDTFTVHVQLRDDDMDSDTDGVSLTVNNVRPVLVVALDQTVNEGALLDLSGIGLAPPLGLYVDPGKLDTHTATVDWGDGSSVESATVFPSAGAGALGKTHIYADNGLYTVTVTVTDDDGGFDTQQFMVTVNNVAPTLVLPNGDQVVAEGTLLSLPNLGTFSDPGFDNPAGGTMESFTYDINWGDGRDIILNAPIADTNGAPGVISTGTIPGSHTYADNGLYTVTVTVYDDDGDSDTMTFDVMVNNVAPTLVLPNGDQVIDEGTLLSLPNLGTFSDPGFDNPAGGTQESFTYDINWGDGRNTIVNSPIADTNGGPGVLSTGTIPGSHTYADNGLYTVTVTVYDDDGDSDTMTFDVMVKNVLPTLDVMPSTTSINEGQTVDFDAMFSDPGFDNPLNPGGATAESFRYFLDWGDGRDQVPNLAVADIDGAPGVRSTGTFDGSHTFADDGVYTVKIRLADDDMSGNFTGGIAEIDYVEKTFTVTVTNVAPSLTGTTNVAVNEGSAFTLKQLSVGLEDQGFDNLLNPNGLPLPADPLRETFRAFEINWGDGSATTPVSIDNVLDRTSGSPGVTTKALFTHSAHTYADDGTYTVTIRVADDNMTGDFAKVDGDVNDYVDLTFTITVNNVLPTLTKTTDKTIAESEDLVIPVLATFSDPGFDNPLNPTTPPAPGNRFNESFTYFLDWGDGRELIGSLAVADLNGSPGTPSTGSFGGTHNYADNGVYDVIIRIADDNMSGNFASGVNGVDYVEQIVKVTVTNVAPSFTPQPNGENLAAPDLDQNGVTTIVVAFNDPGYDNPLNALASNGGEKVETFNHVVQWGDGTVDAIHQYTTSGTFNVTITMTPNGGAPVSVPVAGISSLNPVVNLVGSQQLNDPSVVPQLVTYTVDWGDGHVETFQLSLLNPGLPAGVNGLTTLVGSTRASGNATTLTTGSAAVQHTYLGPPDPLHPTADITITLTVYDDDGGNVTDFIAVGNPGITGDAVAIDTTPDVPRLDLTVQPMTDVFISDQGGLAQLFQIPDIRGGGGEVAANTERYLELRIVYPDGTESEGLKIKDEALADLRAFFKTLPDGQYRIYLVRTENHSERLVIEVDVRHGRVIDVSDDSEGTRDRPPTEEEAPPAVPLDQNPNLEPVPAGEGQGDLETRRQGEIVEMAPQNGQLASLSPPLLVSLSAAALAAEPWSRRVDDALATADESAWKRLRRAGRRGRTSPPPRLAARSWMRTTDNLDYNKN